jgi:hypothetical protein
MSRTKGSEARLHNEQMETLFTVILALAILGCLTLGIVWFVNCLYLVGKIIYVSITYRNAQTCPSGASTLGSPDLSAHETAPPVPAKPRAGKILLHPLCPRFL